MRRSRIKSLYPVYNLSPSEMLGVTSLATCFYNEYFSRATNMQKNTNLSDCDY